MCIYFKYLTIGVIQKEIIREIELNPATIKTCTKTNNYYYLVKIPILFVLIIWRTM